MNGSALWRRPQPSSWSLVEWLWFALVVIIYLDRPKGSVGVVNGFQRVIPSRQRHHHQQQIQFLKPDSFLVADHQTKAVAFSVHRNDDIGTAITIPIAPSTIINGDNTTSIDISNAIKTDTTSTTASTSTESVPFWIVLWRFTRPHTLIGSALAIPALHLLAAPLSSTSPLATFRSVSTMTTMMTSILYATVPALLMNLYITGLNQITDVEIDKINKPNLPIAAGILKRRDAIVTCLVALVASLYMGTYGHQTYSTQGLQVALWGSGLLGTVYSLEPFRLKRYPVFAALCIVAVRGAIINASFFAHAMAAVFHEPSATVLSCLMNDPRCLFSSMFFGVFGIVIALMKDVPDVLGDKSSSIRTFSVRIGPERIFHFSRQMLMGLFYACTAGFVQRAITATTVPLAACRYVVAMACLLAARSVRQQSKSVDPTNPTQVYEYYMHLWKIFYMSYVMLPFAR